ncbi:MAG: hypothetical protein JO197_19175 [Acidobacteria bacterium]|nr:hypothetical protein [Acidobacteriota bacterium]MBV9477071.1 hypothetical protein [Acidobacteriota bacterium]
MSERLSRLAAIVRADFLIRLRRPSTAIIFLLLSASAYLWVPAPSTGKCLIQVNGHRALYDSAAIGMATAMLGTIFIGLAGFYVVSNAIRRDVLSRCGYVIASTTMRGSEYLAGKFAGNVVFLTVFMSGFMLASMSMLIVRGEAPLQPLVFITQYLLLVPPVIVFVSALAILFECTPGLRGKFGDVVYFFLWAGSAGAAASLIDRPNPPVWPRYIDFTGLGFSMHQLGDTLHTQSVSIGASSFDASKPTIVFPGLHFEWAWAGPRIVSTLAPILLLVVARLFFHRFDPARLRAAAAATKRTWIGRFNAMAKPLARFVLALIPRGGSGSLLDAARADAVTTVAAFPLAIVGVFGLAIAALASDAHGLLTGVMPLAYAACAIAVADISCREQRAGTSALVFAAPHLRQRFVAWKFLTSMLVAAAFLAVPIVRASILRPDAALPLVVGLAFTCAAATLLGIVSANPKTFIVGFLTFWYVATQDKGATASLDFAGWFGKATPAVIAAYAGLAMLCLAAAAAYHARVLRARW